MIRPGFRPKMGLAGAFALAGGLTAAFSACSSVDLDSAKLIEHSAAPLSLQRTHPSNGTASVRMPLKDASVTKAIERYGINKKRALGAHQDVGADLDGDGRPEALVYLSDEAWCVKTGCTLVVFRPGPVGYRIVGTVRRVKLPIKVAAATSNGWRDLIVSTGGGGLPRKSVRLQFNGRGYPANASVLQAVPGEMPADGEVLLGAAAAPDGHAAVPEPVVADRPTSHRRPRTAKKVVPVAVPPSAERDYRQRTGQGPSLTGLN